jgi:DNA-binding FrmR family transcriptional regulator
MLTDTKADALKRLNYISGHLDGTKKSVEVYEGANL